MGQNQMDHQDKEGVRGEEAYEEEKPGEAVAAAEDEGDAGGVDEDEVVADVDKGTAGRTDEGVETEDRGLMEETVDAVGETQTAVARPVAAAEQMPLQQHSHAVVLADVPLNVTIAFPLFVTNYQIIAQRNRER